MFFSQLYQANLSYNLRRKFRFIIHLDWDRRKQTRHIARVAKVPERIL